MATMMVLADMKTTLPGRRHPGSGPRGDAGGHGDRHGIVGSRPDQILDHLTVGRARETENGRHIARIAFDEDHIGGFHGDIRTSADGDAEIGLDKSWRIVDAIAHHRHRKATRLQFLDLVRLLIGKHLGEIFGDAEFPGYRFRNALRIARQHHRLYAKAIQFGDGFSRFATHDVGKREERARRTIADKYNHRLAVCFQLLELRMIDRAALPSEMAGADDPKLLAVNLGGNAFAGDIADLGGLGDRDAALLGFSDDAMCNWCSD